VVHAVEGCDDGDGAAAPPWQARLALAGRQVLSERFASEHEAACAWDMAALTLFGAPALPHLNAPRRLSLLRPCVAARRLASPRVASCSHA
jgi:hypothetical protein